MNERMEQGRGSLESRERVPKMVLHIFRHAEKAGGNLVSDEEDMKMPLSDDGRRNARELNSGGDPAQALAVGGLRQRTVETALFALMGERDETDGVVDYDELKKITDREIPLGSKVRRDRRLDVPFVKLGEVHKQLDTAYGQGRYLQTLTDMHDATDSSGATVYETQARNIAQIIRGYVPTAKRWESLRQENPEKYSSDTLERYIGTQGGIVESFIGEVLEQLHGRGVRDEFIHRFPNGFDYTQGCDVEITQTGEGLPSVRLKMICESGAGSPPYVLDEIIPVDILERIAGHSGEDIEPTNKV